MIFRSGCEKFFKISETHSGFKRLAFEMLFPMHKQLFSIIVIIAIIIETKWISKDVKVHQIGERALETADCGRLSY